MMKFMKRKIILFRIISLILIINCIMIGKSVNCRSFDWTYDDSVLLKTIPEENIYMYALDSDEGKGVYEEILLSINGKHRLFHWVVDSGLSFRPDLILDDINNDGKNELIVITTKWEGTGIWTKEVYVFTVDEFKEIKVKNPLEVVKERVKTRVDKSKEEGIEVRIKIGNEERILKSEELDTVYKESLFKNNWNDELFFGNKIDYEVLDGKLICILGGEAYVTWIGDIVIDYKFQNGELVDDKVSFRVKDI